MNRCMVLAATLFDPFRTPSLTRTADGFFDEAQDITPGQWARLERALP